MPGCQKLQMMAYSGLAQDGLQRVDPHCCAVDKVAQVINCLSTAQCDRLTAQIRRSLVTIILALARVCLKVTAQGLTSAATNARVIWVRSYVHYVIVTPNTTNVCFVCLHVSFSPSVYLSLYVYVSRYKLAVERAAYLFFFLFLCGMHH